MRMPERTYKHLKNKGFNAFNHNGQAILEFAAAESKTAGAVTGHCAGRNQFAWPLAVLAAGIVHENRPKAFPALAVELHHLQLLVDAIVVRRGIADDSRQRKIELDILEIGGLLHDVL